MQRLPIFLFKIFLLATFSSWSYTPLTERERANLLLSRAAQRSLLHGNLVCIESYALYKLLCLIIALFLNCLCFYFHFSSLFKLAELESGDIYSELWPLAIVCGLTVISLLLAVTIFIKLRNRFKSKLTLLSALNKYKRTKKNAL